MNKCLRWQYFLLAAGECPCITSRYQHLNYRLARVAVWEQSLTRGCINSTLHVHLSRALGEGPVHEPPLCAGG
jgi:hypothetical protein